jgi:probable F420-dependent oxidoreductase
MMDGMRPFRFIAHPAPGIVTARQLTETARRAEAIGYDVLVLPDHLLEQHAPVPALATIAALTERVRIGTFVINAQLRHPAVLAQDLASLDVLSGGRLEIGVGAGWNGPEFAAVGLPFEPVGDRVARLAEVVAVLKGCFGDGPFSYQGRHFTLTRYDGLPKPSQRPHPPIFIGAGGRRALTLAGREADIVGLAPRLMTGGRGVPTADPRSLTAAATAEKIEWVRAAAGDRFDRLEINTYPTGGPVVVTNDARGQARLRADQLRAASGIDITEDEVLESPHVFIGSVDGLAQKFIELRERFGISSVMVGEVDTLAPVVQRLAGR